MEEAILVLTLVNFFLSIGIFIRLGVIIYELATPGGLVKVKKDSIDGKTSFVESITNKEKFDESKNIGDLLNK